MYVCHLLCLYLKCTKAVMINDKIFKITFRRWRLLLSLHSLVTHTILKVLVILDGSREYVGSATVSFILFQLVPSSSIGFRDLNPQRCRQQSRQCSKLRLYNIYFVLHDLPNVSSRLWRRAIHE